MRVLVCGGRTFLDYYVLGGVLDTLHQEKNITELVHGGAKGADVLAGVWATANKVKTTVFPADWAKYPRAAGPIRNNQMAAYGADLVVAFPGQRGTKHMIMTAKKNNIPVMLVDQRGGTHDFVDSD